MKLKKKEIIEFPSDAIKLSSLLLHLIVFYPLYRLCIGISRVRTQPTGISRVGVGWN